MKWPHNGKCLVGPQGYWFNPANFVSEEEASKGVLFIQFFMLIPVGVGLFSPNINEVLQQFLVFGGLTIMGLGYLFLIYIIFADKSIMT